MPLPSSATAAAPAATTQAAVLQERARIARELHDTVSQTLYAITLGASRALTVLQQNERTDVQCLVDRVLQLANTAESELRALLTDIRSERSTSSGLAAALADLAGDVRGRDGMAGLDIRVSVADAPDMPAATEHAVLMIVREALHNVARHAAARQVDVVLERTPGRLILQITDDGRGFDPPVLRPGHFGLQSMRERAAAVGGTLALISAIGAGTQLRVSVPLGQLDTDG